MFSRPVRFKKNLQILCNKKMKSMLRFLSLSFTDKNSDVFYEISSVKYRCIVLMSTFSFAYTIMILHQKYNET